MRLLLMVTVFSVSLACGSLAPGISSEGERRGEGPAVRVGSVVASQTACVYAGRPQVTSGDVVITVENRSSYHVNFRLREIVDDHTYAEFVDWVARNNERLQTTNDPSVPPPDWVIARAVEDMVPPGGRAELESPVSRGTYAIECGWVDENAPRREGARLARLVRADATGPLTVTP